MRVLVVVGSNLKINTSANLSRTIREWISCRHIDCWI